MSATTLPAGPPDLGLELGADLRVTDDGWLVRDLVTPLGLDGPADVLQGGLAAGIAIEAARAVDQHGAPVTALDARLHAPTPLGRTLEIRVRRTDTVAHYDVETRDGDRLLVSASVELAGHDPAPRAYDLLDLGRVPLPEPDPPATFPHCWVCGTDPRHPLGQRILPRWHAPGAMTHPWVADEELGDDRGVVAPLVVAAVLDCPTALAAWHHVEEQGWAGVLLGSYQLRFFRDAPVMEPLRTVARLDEVSGRKVRARGGLVDEDGVLYAVSSGLHIGVTELPAFS